LASCSAEASGYRELLGHLLFFFNAFLKNPTADACAPGLGLGLRVIGLGVTFLYVNKMKYTVRV